MHSHELLREIFQRASPKQVAADLSLSLSMIYKWAEPPDEAAGSGTVNPLDRIEALLRRGPPGSLVEAVSVVRMPATGRFEGFSVRPAGHSGD